MRAFWNEQIAGTAETAVSNGGSPWAAYWTQTVAELPGGLVASGKLGFAAVHARAPGG